MSPQDTSHHRPLLALAIRLCAVAVLSTMAMLVKLASEHGIHLLEIIFWRQGLTIPIALMIAAATGGISQFRTTRPKTHAVRAIYGMTAMSCNFFALTLLPLAEAVTFGFTAPIFAVILSVILLRETVGIYRIGAILAGFAGVLIIAQPGNGHLNMLGAAVGLGGAFMIALTSIQVAELTRTEKPLTVVFWFSTTSTPFIALFLPFVMISHGAGDWAILMGIGALGIVGQVLLTASLRFGAVSSVIVMEYSSLIWATLYGWLLWDRLPPGSTWIGAPIIVAAGLVIAWRERGGLQSRVKVTELVGD